MKDDRLQKEANDRLADCRKQKNAVERDIREAYFFYAPSRHADISSMSSATATRSDDARVLQTSLGIEVGQDFATEVASTLLPQSVEWAQQKAAPGIEEDEWEGVKDDVEAQTTEIHKAIKASNFYPCVAGAFEGDLPHGTVAMWISDLRADQPPICQAIPARELEINLGPYGDIDDRFIVRSTRYRYVAALLPGVTLPKEVVERAKKKPNDKCRVTWGFWRKWEVESEETWQAVILIDKTLVDASEISGEGCCPVIVGRWGPDPLLAWGNGPTVKSLPELRRLDETEALKIENADHQIHPPFTYPDDGVVNFSGGVLPGTGYPARPGGGKDFVKLSFEGNAQFAEYETIRMEERIRRLHFVDFPTQRGKTPPTAEQWLEELQRAKKRLGTPGTIFWREFAAATFLRFKDILLRRGTVQPVELDGKALSLAAFDPMEVAQDQQDAMVAMRLTQWCQASFPQTWEVQADGEATMKNMQKALRDNIVVFRTAEQVKDAVQTLGPVLGGGGPAGASAPGAEVMPE